MINILDDEATFFELSFVIPKLVYFTENPTIFVHRESTFNPLYITLVETGASSNSFEFRNKYYCLMGKWNFKTPFNEGVTYRISRINHWNLNKDDKGNYPLEWGRLINGEIVECLPNYQYDIISTKNSFGDYIAEVR